MNAKIEVKFLTGVVEKYEPLMTSSFFALMRGYSAGKKRGRLQTNIANMDLWVVLILALFENITIWKFRVNGAKILDGSEWTKCPVNLFNRSRRGQTTPKGLIKAKFTYLLHLFSFLDQTCQIDYRCWPNDCKFKFDAKCQIVTTQRLTSPKWVKWSFQFQSQTYIIWKCFRRGIKPRKPFLATTRTTRVMGLQRNLIAAPGTILFLKKRSLWYFFSQFFAK